MTNLDSIASLLSIDISAARIDELYLAGEIQFPYWAFSFGVGMTVALLFSRRQAIAAAFGPGRARAAQLAAVAGFAAIAALVAVVQPASVHYSPLVGLLYTALIGLFAAATIFSGERWQMPFINAPVRWLGDVSYGIYLIHLVIITCLARLVSMPSGTAGAAAVWLLAVVPASILWGYMSARVIERPIRARAARWARRATRDTTGP